MELALASYFYAFKNAKIWSPLSFFFQETLAFKSDLPTVRCLFRTEFVNEWDKFYANYLSCVAIFILAEESRSDGCTDEISIESVINLKRNLARRFLHAFFVCTRYTHSTHSHDLSQRSHVALFGRSQNVAQSCHMPVSGREKHPDISEGTDLIAVRNFYCTNDMQFKWHVRALIITTDYVCRNVSACVDKCIIEFITYVNLAISLNTTYMRMPA